MNHTDEHFCPFCGVDYIHHNGLIPTCAELQKAKLKIERLKGKLADYRNEKLKVSNHNMKTPEEWWAISQRHTTQPAGFIKLIEAIQRDAIESVKKLKQQPKKTKQN